MNMDQSMAHKKNSPPNPDRAIAPKYGPPPMRVLSAMPIQVLYQPPTVGVTFEKQGGETLLRFTAPRIADWPHDGSLDAHFLRDAFLATRTQGEAVELLCLSGLFCLEPGQD